MNGSTLKTPPSLSDHRIGSLNAKIVLLEYGDFECPHCARTAPVIQRLVDEYAGNICFIYRHFPILKKHPDAGVAAVAAEAAGKQGKFWEMHDLLFQHSDQLAGDKMLFLARDINLNMRQFLNDLENEDLAQKVHEDFLSAKVNGVNSTPTLFLNGTHIQGVPDYQTLKEAMENILKDIGGKHDYNFKNPGRAT